MTINDPLPLRCLALTGSFETGQLPPGCFGSLAGDSDGQGISFSALQWNVGQQTLQPLLNQMCAQHADLAAQLFGTNYPALCTMLQANQRALQLAWARSIQGPITHKILPEWASAFAALGAAPEWQAIAVRSAAGYFDHAKFQSSQFKLGSDRAMALLFDCAVQNGGVPDLALHHVLDQALPSWGEAEIMRAIANAVADSANPRWRQDVLARKLAIANGQGVVHGVQYDLASQFGL